MFHLLGSRPGSRAQGGPSLAHLQRLVHDLWDSNSSLSSVLETRGPGLFLLLHLCRTVTGVPRQVCRWLTLRREAQAKRHVARRALGLSWWHQSRHL